MPGYGHLAGFMSSRQDTEIFRRFSSLNVETLLHMQAELSALEMSLDVMREDSDWNAFDSSWLRAPRCNGNAVVGEMFEKARVLLEQYRQYDDVLAQCLVDTLTDSTILRTARVNALERAPHDSYQLLQAWFDEETGGDNFLRGVEAAVFRDKSCRGDLLVVNKRQGRDDPIAVFIADKVLPLYDRLIGYRFHRSMPAAAFHDVREYHMRTMLMIGNMLCMLLSAVLPALAILVLFNVKSMILRLVTIVLMSLIFSLVMTAITQKKAEMFMSTTAFVAIMVVFVSSSESQT